MANDLTIYCQVRCEMRTGDALNYKGQGKLPSLISFFSKSPWTHSSVIDNLGEDDTIRDRVWTWEAQADGLFPHYLSEVLKNYKGDVWWFPLKPEYNPYRPQIREFMQMVRGYKYDSWAFVKQIAGRVSSTLKKLFCSEAVIKSYKYAGFITPEIIEFMLEKYKIDFDKKDAQPGDIPNFPVFLPPVQIITYTPDEVDTINTPQITG